MDGHEVGRAGRPPLGPVSGDPTGWDQAVHVRMVGQGPGPGVQHTQDPDQPADIMRVRGELDERLGRGAEQDVVEVLLVAADERPQLVGHGEDDVKVGDRQEFLPPLFQPGFGVLAVALGATAVAAGVVDIVFLATVVALATGVRLGPRSDSGQDRPWPDDGWAGGPRRTGPGSRGHSAGRRPPPPAWSGSDALRDRP